MGGIDRIGGIEQGSNVRGDLLGPPTPVFFVSADSKGDDIPVTLRL